MKRNLLLSIILLGCLFSTRVYAGDDFQYWSWLDLKLLDTRYVDYVNHSQLRFFDDSSDFGLWFTSQRLKVDAFENLKFGLNYTYLENEAKSPRNSGKEFKSQHRLELEANPEWKSENGLRVKNRNRFEFRWIEDKGSDNARFRHLWGLEFPLTKMKGVQSIYFNNEFFVDFGKREINENRAVPLGVSFKLHEKVGFNVFYMIQSQKGKDWRSNHILGTKLSLSL